MCRELVQSSALNISLQNLICTYTNNQHLLKKEGNDNKPEEPKAQDMNDY